MRISRCDGGAESACPSAWLSQRASGWAMLMYVYLPSFKQVKVVHRLTNLPSMSRNTLEARVVWLDSAVTFMDHKTSRFLRASVARPPMPSAVSAGRYAAHVHGRKKGEIRDWLILFPYYQARELETLRRYLTARYPFDC